MGKCCVIGCPSRSYRKSSKQVVLEGETGRISFHKFPVDEARSKLWAVNLRDEDFKPNNNTIVCSLHFTKDCYHNLYDEGRLRKVLKSDALPNSDFPALKYLKKGTPTKVRKELETKMSSFVYCVVATCSNVKIKENKTCLGKNGSPVFFYQFPEDKGLRRLWIEATGRKILAVQSKMTICSEHFDKSCFAFGASSTVIGKKIKLLKKDAIPTIGLPKVSVLHSPNILKRPPIQGPQIIKPDLQQLLNLKNLPGAVSVSGNFPVTSTSSQSSNFKLLSNTQVTSSCSPQILRTLLVNGNSNTPVFQTVPQLNFSSQSGVIQASGQSQLMIKNDLTQPVVFLGTPNKLLATSVQSAAKNRLSSMPNTSCVQVDPNSFITVQSPKNQSEGFNSRITGQPQNNQPAVKKVQRIPECTCPTDKYFREGAKQIRILTEHEGKLRSKNVKKARLLKSLQLSRVRGEEKIQEIKSSIKELRRDIERKERAVPAAPSTVKFFREFLKQHNRPINLDGPVRSKYGRETKKFAIKLFSQSPEAYTYVREAFNKRLPRSKLIHKWCLKAKESNKEMKSLDVNSEILDRIIDQMNAGGRELDSDLDDESVTSTHSSDDEDEEIRKLIRDEINVEIETEVDADGNVINHVPANIEDEVISDADSDSDFEMLSFTTLCDSGPIIPIKASNTNDKPEPRLKHQTPETVYKVNSNAVPRVTPGARFETFAI